MSGDDVNSDDDAARRRARRKKRFFIARVSVLLFVLFVVTLYAVRDLRSRHSRRDWDRTLDVVVVLVHVEPRADPPQGARPTAAARVDADAVAAIKERSGALEDRLRSEAARHNGSLPKPFRIRVLGPVDVVTPPPSPPTDSTVDLAKQALALQQWLADVDPRAGVVPDHWDTRIYVAARRPASETMSFVEGQSQQDGRIGMVSVELDRDMVDLTLFVVTHELMHTLGATDKYDESSGRTRAPDGLAEPDRVPLYPQRFAEVMARNLAISPTSERPPSSLDELAIGGATAKEIGWLR